MDTRERESGRARRLRPRHVYRAILPLAVLIPLLWASCAYHRPLYIYRAYQDPQTAGGPYYLREALVVAPNHASAMGIMARTMNQLNRGWSGPLYVSLIGISEGKREPGLLGGPLWLEALPGAKASPPPRAATSGE